MQAYPQMIVAAQFHPDRVLHDSFVVSCALLKPFLGREGAIETRGIAFR